MDPQRTEFTLAVMHTGSGRDIGSAALWVTDADHRTGEFGFVLDREY